MFQFEASKTLNGYAMVAGIILGLLAAAVSVAISLAGGRG
jgi:hypothetical protein